MRSIRRSLLVWLAIGLAVGIAAAAGITYTQARDDANELFDYQMKQMAASLPREAGIAMETPHGDGADIDVDADVLIQIWDRTGVRIYHSHERPSLPRRVTLGFSNLATSDGEWRVYAALYGETVVQVAQPVSARRELAARNALRSTAPLLVLWPILLLLVWIAVGRGLAPVNKVAQEMRSRGTQALAPLSESGMPEEILPLTHALNDLLARLNRAISAQRDFVADAAHELRTPLTALGLQLQLLERAQNDGERTAATADLRRGLERVSHLVQQLLTLSRQEHDPGVAGMHPVDLLQLARLVAADQAPIAAQKNIDLGVVGDASATISGDAEALRAMLGNVVNNAIRYTPSPGRVDIAVDSDLGLVHLSVTDTGPGIPEADWSRVFDRFYRRDDSGQQGSGLGLAIVKNVVDRHGGNVRLGRGPGDKGLAVTMEFPGS